MNLDRRLLRLTRPVRVPMALAVALGLLAGLLLVIQAFLLSRTISCIFLDDHTLRDVRGLLVALAGIALVRAGVLWGGEVAAHAVAGRIKADLRDRLFAHIVALGPAYTFRERSGELVNTATEGIEQLDATFSQYLPQIALAALLPAAMLIFVFPVDPLSGLVLLLTAPLIPFFMMLIGSAANALARRQWITLSRLSAQFLDSLQGLPTLKLFGRSRDQAQALARAGDRFRDTTMSVLRMAFLSALVLEMLATISTAIIAVQVGLRLLYWKISFEQAFFVLILAPEFYLPLRTLGARFHAGVSGVAAALRVFEVLETPLPQNVEPQRRGERGEEQEITPHPPTPSPSGGRRGVDLDVSPRPLWAGVGGDIRFEGVQVAYDGGDRPALRGASFCIPPGQVTALVGPSGAGKSTVVHALLRFIEPDRGAITVGDVPLSDLPAGVWRARIAWVPQRPYLFAATIAENIRLARPDAPLEDVIRAAQSAHADDFIWALPQGYDTPIGERGARLSGGQAQRIALARAFLKDAPLLILDEATAHLDPDTETLLIDAMRALMQDRTVLIVAHRLGTVADADQIVVMDGGRVAEIGTHRALLDRGGLYRRLVSAGEDAP